MPSSAHGPCPASAAFVPQLPVPAWGGSALFPFCPALFIYFPSAQRYLPSAHKVVAQHQINVNTGLGWAPALLPDTPAAGKMWVIFFLFTNFLIKEQRDILGQRPDTSVRINI